MLKPEQTVQQQQMAPMPFYTDPTRFSTPVWQAETTQTWPQGQFIQQIQPTAQAAVPTLEPYGQQYPNGLYQTTYQQAGFEANTFYTGAVQVLTNARPPSASEHPQLTSRSNGSYSHTPSPVPQTPQQSSTPRSNISASQYQEYMSQQGYAAPSTPTGNVDNQSRPSSVNSVVNAPSNNQNFQPNGSSSNFSPGSNTNPSYVNANSGNEKPGYPQVSSNPQLASHNSSGYPGNQFSGEEQQSMQQQHHQNQDWQIGAENMMWEPHIHSQQESSKDIHNQQEAESSENLNNPYTSTQANNHRVELNSRIKTMILNKQNSGDRKVVDEAQMGEDNKATGHFLWYSHHRHPPDIMDGGGGVPYPGGKLPGNYLPPNATPTRLTPTRVTPTRLTPTGLIANNSTLTEPTSKNHAANGLISNTLITNGLISNGLPANDLKLKGLTSNRLTPNGLTHNNLTSNGLLSNGALSNTPIPTSFTPTSFTPTNFTPSTFTSTSFTPTSFTPTSFTSRSFPPTSFTPTSFIPSSFIPTSFTPTGFTPTTLIPNKQVSNSPLPHPVLQNHINRVNQNKENSATTSENTHRQIVVNCDSSNRERISREIQHVQQPLPNQVQQVQIENFPSVKVESKLPEDEKVKNISTEIPSCNCFPPDKLPPEPGSYYTHLGCSSSLINLRKDFESRTGVNGKAIRMEKVRYTGKEGKTPQGCPIAKWIIRRSSYDEKYLVIVKHRQGHVCTSAYIVVCIVAWEGIMQPDADGLYSTLTEKLNKFGLPTTRRCATNEQRTCACQGLDPKTCGASFSFGCSWSMYYNGCKFARSKIVRKFRLTERTEEENMETKLQSLTTSLGPLYKALAPDSFKNQCNHEKEAEECRLGLKDGKPFSGVTACMDFCAHAHKDSHNMNDGCTAVVTLTKERSLAKHDDEQLHVLPLYSMETTDEFGSKEDQDEKYKNGSVEVLTKYECEVRIRTVPLQPCRRRKKKEEDNHSNTPIKKDNISRSSSSSGYESSRSQTPKNERVLQSNHVSSTRLDSPITPPGWLPNNFGGYHHHQNQFEENPYNIFNGYNSSSVKNSVLFPTNNTNTAFDVSYPKQHEPFNRIESVTSQPAQRNYMQNKVQDSHSGIRNSHSLINSISTTTTVNNIIDYSTGIVNNRNDSSIYNGIRTPRNQSLYNHFASTPLKGSPYPFKVPSSPIPPHSPMNGFQNHHHHFQNHHNFQNHFGYPSHTKSFYNIPHSPYHLHQDVWYNHPHHQDINKSFYYKQQPFMYPPKPLPPIHFFNNNQNINPNTYHLRNPFDDISDFGTKRFIPFPSPHEPEPNSWQSTKLNNWDPVIAEQPESLGKVIDVIDNTESFADSQVGGVAIALTHGSVLFECAKHELHATTALKKPNRLSPTRISLVFYQHRNLNRAKHGWDQWEEKTRLKKMSLNESQKLNYDCEPKIKLEEGDSELLMRAPTLTTMSVTTLFPMYPCIVTGPYKEQQSFS